MGNGVSNEMEIFAEGEMETELKRLGGTGDTNVRKLLDKGYVDMVHLVIRPKRAIYNVNQLGPNSFPIDLFMDPHQVNVRRRDFDVYNSRELRVCCSHWQHFQQDQSVPMVTPCLIYLHSNVGSRLDSLRVRDAALKRGFSVLTFDYCGSGLSDGIYVTMGWYESMDLLAVLQSIDKDDSVSDILLYAHSMSVFPVVSNLALRAIGAADKKMQSKLQILPYALRSATLMKPIRAVVLDSAYTSVKEVNKGLVREMQQAGFPVPRGAMKVAISAINYSVRKRTDVNMELLRPIDFVGLCYAPALFVAAINDKYVSIEQSEELARKYGGPSKVVRVEGAHYDLRDASTYEQAVEFLYKVLHPTPNEP